MKRADIKRRPLSDTTLLGLEPDAKEYREHDGNGLYFRVKPDGQKSWQLRYKTPAGKWSWLSALKQELATVDQYIVEAQEKHRSIEA